MTLLNPETGFISYEHEGHRLHAVEVDDGFLIVEPQAGVQHGFIDYYTRREGDRRIMVVPTIHNYGLKEHRPVEGHIPHVIVAGLIALVRTLSQIDEFHVVADPSISLGGNKTLNWAARAYPDVAVVPPVSYDPALPRIITRRQ